ncbi:MAG: spore germination protein GerW family protein [Anaerolineae bacterium]
MSDIVSRFFQVFEESRASASVQAVFGPPETRGEVTVIPAAAVRYGIGFGMGANTPESTERVSAQGLGGGGGAGTRARPVAVIEITPTEVKVHPIIDYSRLILAGVCALVWLTFLWSGVLKKFIASRTTAH